MTPELFDFENVDISPEFLQTFDEYRAGKGSFKSLFASYTWACMALHEKIHGIQNYNLPLPLLEIVAHYYEWKTFKRANWESRYIEGFERSTAYWDELINEIGEDVHRCAFGTLEPGRLKEVSDLIKSKFGEEKMEELFGENERFWPVKWTE